MDPVDARFYEAKVGEGAAQEIYPAIVIHRDIETTVSLCAQHIHRAGQQRMAHNVDE